MTTPELPKMTWGQDLDSASNTCIIGSKEQTLLIQHHLERPISTTTLQCYHAPQLQSNFNNKRNRTLQRKITNERKRVKEVSNGFDNLRKHIQPVLTGLTKDGTGISKTLAKLKTIKFAIKHIKELETILNDSSAETNYSDSPMQEARLHRVLRHQ